MDEGAGYGVTATILDAKSNTLVAQLERLIVDTGAVAGDGGAGDASFGESDDGGTTTAAAGASDSGTGTEGETVSGEVGGEAQENVDDCSDVVACGVNDVQDELPPGPSSSSEEEEEPDVVPGGGGGGSNSGGDGLLGGVLGDDGPLSNGLKLIRDLSQL